jgi:hypothetical protein
MKLFSFIALAALAAALVCAVGRNTKTDSRRQFADAFNHTGGTLRYSTDAYQNRVLVITQSDGDMRAGMDLLTYLGGVDEVRAHGFLSINYRTGVASAESPEIWLDVSHETKGSSAWWVREILA